MKFIALVALAMLTLVTFPAVADSRTDCRVDSGGHRICVERDRETRERCTETCRVDSGGHRVCKTVCR